MGKPRVVLMPGDAGIGKSRLLSEVRAPARRGGFRVYHGRCYEDMQVPYLPFIEALRSQREPNSGEAEGICAEEDALIEQLLTRVVVSTSGASAFTTAQADQDRLRVFLEVSRAVLTVAQRSPTLFVIMTYTGLILPRSICCSISFSLWQIRRRVSRCLSCWSVLTCLRKAWSVWHACLLASSVRASAIRFHCGALTKRRVISS